MGLSASQARLLSITARLTDNELHSQSIGNAKVRLAGKTQNASKEYLNALNAKKLVFTTYDAKGTSTTQNLTPAFLYQYTPMKNQYVMQDSNGNYLLSGEDIKNFEETGNLMQFLQRYDLFSLDMYEQAMRDYQEDLKNYNEKRDNYNEAYAKYQNDLATYNSQKADYDTNYKKWKADKDQYDADYQNYLDALSKPQLYDEFANLVGTQENRNREAGACYDNFLDSGDVFGPGCYAHLLEHLLDYRGGDTFSDKTYYTSYTDPATGENDSLKVKGETGANMHSYVKDNSTWLEFVDAVNDDENRKCDADDHWNGVEDEVKDNSLQDIIAKGGTPSKKDILLSDYTYDPKNNKVGEVKSLKQKMIDILYMIYHKEEFDMSFEDWKETLVNFTEGDMRNLSSPPTEPPPFTDKEPTPPEVPVEPTEPKKPEIFTRLADQDKAQWYVNLWYMMNGSDTANLVKEDGTTDYKGVFVVPSVEKNKGAKVTYKALDENLMKSEAWIKFALEHGIVTFVQAQYISSSEDSGKAIEITSEGITWKPTVWSSCVDISSVDDEAKIAKAEAEYNHKLNEIQVKDKKYDNEIKKLDTEHNALQTEFDSIKEIINKNEERSFKAFS